MPVCLIRTITSNYQNHKLTQVLSVLKKKTKKTKKTFYLFYFVYMNVLPTCMSVHPMLIPIGFLELEIWMVLRHHVGAETQTRILYKSKECS